MKTSFLSTLIIKSTLFCMVMLLSVSIATSNNGAQFLKIGVGSRAIGMGNAFTGIANDVTALHYNPAGLTQLNQREVSAMHNQWIVDTNMDFIGIGLPIISNSGINNGVIGIGILNLSYGNMEGRDENRQQTGSFGANDMSLSVGYSKRMTNITSYGVTVKLIQQNIESMSTTGIAFDIGMLHKTAINNMDLGLSMQNIGTEMKFINEGYNLPLSITAGLGYRIGGITIGCDVKNYIYEGQTVIGLGTEYVPVTSFALRAGYILPLLKKTYKTGSKLGDSIDTNGLGAGLGFKLFNIQTDYSFVPYGDLGNTHRISFSSKF